MYSEDEENAFQIISKNNNDFGWGLDNAEIRWMIGNIFHGLEQTKSPSGIETGNILRRVLRK